MRTLFFNSQGVQSLRSPLMEFQFRGAELTLSPPEFVPRIEYVYVFSLEGFALLLSYLSVLVPFHRSVKMNSHLVSQFFPSALKFLSSTFLSDVFFFPSGLRWRHKSLSFIRSVSRFSDTFSFPKNIGIGFSPPALPCFPFRLAEHPPSHTQDQK